MRQGAETRELVRVVACKSKRRVRIQKGTNIKIYPCMRIAVGINQSKEDEPSAQNAAPQKFCRKACGRVDGQGSGRVVERHGESTWMMEHCRRRDVWSQKSGLNKTSDSFCLCTVACLAVATSL